MFERAVLGVDPGVASAGLALVRDRPGRPPEVAWWATVTTPPGLAEGERLRALHREVREALAAHRPSALALERLLWGRNTGSAMAVARAAGVVLLAAAEAAVPVREYAPLEVKMAVTGDGRAGKAQVRRALERVLAVRGVPGQPDAADAVAVAVCHLNRAALDRAVEASR